MGREEIRAVKGCGKKVPNAYYANHFSALSFANRCDSCLDLLIAKARESGLLEGAQEVCSSCGGRTPNYRREVVGPNSAGNYVHEYRVTADPPVQTLCRASSIHSLLRYIRSLPAGKEGR